MGRYPTGNPNGRPRKPINKGELEKLCGIQCTIEEIAGWFNCHEDTIRRFCEREYGMKFHEVYDKFSANGKISIRRTQFRIAEDGNATMAIWLGKQYLGQTDKQDLNLDAKQDFVFNILPASSRSKDEESDS